MPELIDIEVFKQHVGGVQAKLSITVMEPFLRSSERWFKGKIGTTLFSLISELAADNDLRTLAAGCISWHAFWIAQPHLHVKIGDLGSAKNLPPNMVALTKWEYLKLEESAIAMIDTHLENFWQAVEAAQLPTYVASDEWKKRRSAFITTATELTEQVPLVRGSVRLFEEFTLHLRKAEKYYLAEVMTPQVYAELKAKLPRADLTELEQELIGICREVVANFGVLRGLDFVRLLVDADGIRVIEKSDSTRNELQASTQILNKLRLDLKAEGELALGSLRSFLYKHSSSTVFPEFYQKNISSESATNPVLADKRANPIL